MEFSNELQCPICFERFQNPRSLNNCLHTFCENCLLQTFVSFENRNRGNFEFPCPVCRVPVDGPAVGRVNINWIRTFPVNHVVNSLLHCVQQEENVEPSCEPCANTNRSVAAAAFCIQCQEFMCLTCKHVHEKFKATKSHTIVSINELKTDKRRAIDFSKCLQCKFHKDKEVELFCVDDKLPVCVICVSTTHRDCRNIVELKIEAESHDRLKQTKKQQEKLKEFQQGLKSLILNMEQNVVDLEGQESEIQTILDTKMAEVVSILNRYQVDIMDKFKYLKGNKIQSMNEELAKCKRLYSAIKSSSSSFDTVMKYGSRTQAFTTMFRMESEFNEYESFMEKAEKEIQSEKVVVIDRPPLWHFLNAYCIGYAKLQTYEPEIVAATIEKFEGKSKSKEAVELKKGDAGGMAPETSGTLNEVGAVGGNLAHEEEKTPGPRRIAKVKKVKKAGGDGITWNVSTKQLLSEVKTMLHSRLDDQDKKSSVSLSSTFATASTALTLTSSVSTDHKTSFTFSYNIRGLSASNQESGGAKPKSSDAKQITAPNPFYTMGLDKKSTPAETSTDGGGKKLKTSVSKPTTAPRTISFSTTPAFNFAGTAVSSQPSLSLSTDINTVTSQAQGSSTSLFQATPLKNLNSKKAKNAVTAKSTTSNPINIFSSVPKLTSSAIGSGQISFASASSTNSSVGFSFAVPKSTLSTQPTQAAMSFVPQSSSTFSFLSQSKPANQSAFTVVTTQSKPTSFTDQTALPFVITSKTASTANSLNAPSSFSFQTNIQAQQSSFCTTKPSQTFNFGSNSLTKPFLLNTVSTSQPGSLEPGFDVLKVLIGDTSNASGQSLPSFASVVASKSTFNMAPIPSPPIQLFQSQIPTFSPKQTFGGPPAFYQPLPQCKPLSQTTTGQHLFSNSMPMSTSSAQNSVPSFPLLAAQQTAGFQFSSGQPANQNSNALVFPSKPSSSSSSEEQLNQNSNSLLLTNTTSLSASQSPAFRLSLSTISPSLASGSMLFPISTLAIPVHSQLSTTQSTFKALSLGSQPHPSFKAETASSTATFTALSLSSQPHPSSKAEAPSSTAAFTALSLGSHPHPSSKAEAPSSATAFTALSLGSQPHPSSKAEAPRSTAAFPALSLGSQPHPSSKAEAPRSTATQMMLSSERTTDKISSPSLTQQLSNIAITSTLDADLTSSVKDMITLAPELSKNTIAQADNRAQSDESERVLTGFVKQMKRSEPDNQNNINNSNAIQPYAFGGNTSLSTFSSVSLVKASPKSRKGRKSIKSPKDKNGKNDEASPALTISLPENWENHFKPIFEEVFNEKHIQSVVDKVMGGLNCNKGDEKTQVVDGTISTSTHGQLMSVDTTPVPEGASTLTHSQLTTGQCQATSIICQAKDQSVEEASAKTEKSKNSLTEQETQIASSLLLSKSLVYQSNDLNNSIKESKENRICQTGALENSKKESKECKTDQDTHELEGNTSTLANACIDISKTDLLDEKESTEENNVDHGATIERKCDTNDATEILNETKIMNVDKDIVSCAVRSAENIERANETARYVNDYGVKKGNDKSENRKENESLGSKDAEPAKVGGSEKEHSEATTRFESGIENENDSGKDNNETVGIKDNTNESDIKKEVIQQDVKESEKEPISVVNDTETLKENNETKNTVESGILNEGGIYLHVSAENGKVKDECAEGKTNENSDFEGVGAQNSGERTNEQVATGKTNDNAVENQAMVKSIFSDENETTSDDSDDSSDCDTDSEYGSSNENGACGKETETDGSTAKKSELLR